MSAKEISPGVRSKEKVFAMTVLSDTCRCGTRIERCAAPIAIFASCMSLRSLLAITILTSVLPAALRAAPERWAAEIDALTRNDRDQPPPRGGVVFVGSSSIVGWKTLAADFPDFRVIQRGFGGSELADSVHYAERVVLPYEPRAVVLYAGDNDLANGKSPEAILEDFRAFHRKLHAALPATRIVYIAIKPSASRWKLRDQMIATNRLIADECSRDPRLRFVDVFTPMLNAHGEPRAELFVEDQLHLNAAGYALWTPLVAAQLRP